MRYRKGAAALDKLLQGYCADEPFAVVSDAFPAGYLPRPVLPGAWFEDIPDLDRKQGKKRQWLPQEHFLAPLAQWPRYCRTAEEVGGVPGEFHPQPHNTIDRRSGTTGVGQFAPHSSGRFWYGNQEQKAAAPPVLDCYLGLDTQRLSAEDAAGLLADIGNIGYGRDASIGLGKFRLEAFSPCTLPSQTEADAWLTLAPCAPGGLAWDAARCFYHVFTRFGRHGDTGALHGQPFKTPLLLAAGAAVLTPSVWRETTFVGQRLGGDGSLSKAIPGTVQQGYAPVVGIHLPSMEEQPR